MSETTLYQLVSPSGKRYVGITSDFDRRMKQHSWTNHKHLKSEFEKHDIDDFTILKTNFDNKEKALRAETKLIRSYNKKGISLNKNNASSVVGVKTTKELKADVKIKCAREGKTIRQVVEELLKEWVKK